MRNDFKEQSLSDFLKRRLEEMKSEHTDHLSGGSCKDFGEYQKMVGIVEGLSLAEREMFEWVGKFIESDG